MRAHSEKDSSGVLGQVVQRPIRTEAEGVGPRAALKAADLGSMDSAARAAWLEESRVDAILGSCRRSLKSVRSGIMCWMSFMRAMDPTAPFFPPQLAYLMAWSRMFRCARTFANYLGHVRTGCTVAGQSTAALDDPSLKRAKLSIAKANLFVQREKKFVRLEDVEAMLRVALDTGQYVRHAHLFLVAYAFLLRLPSEALPMMAGDCGTQASMFMEDGKLVVKLRRRKNKPHGSRLVRSCWCKQHAATCPTCVLGPWLEAMDVGTPIFGGISAADALSALRALLVQVGVADAGAYRTHDMRRGHADDLRKSGAPLWQILAAGEWCSPAFLAYLNLHQLETDLVVQASQLFESASAGNGSRGAGAPGQ